MSKQKVYLVNGSSQYYPGHDNTYAVFTDEQKAEKCKEKLENAESKEECPDYVDGKRPHIRDLYTVIQKKVRQ